MKFFYKYLHFIYIILYALAFVSYIIATSAKIAAFLYVFLVLITLATILLSFASWREVRFLHKTYRSFTPEEKFSIIESEGKDGYKAQLKILRKTNRKYYLSAFLRACLLGVLSIAVLIIIIRAVIG